MGKQNLGKKIMQALHDVKEKGLVPDEFGEKNHLPYREITAQIQRWEQQGKVVCIKEAVTPHISRYALSKYAEQDL